MEEANPRLPSHLLLLNRVFLEREKYKDVIYLFLTLSVYLCLFMYVHAYIHRRIYFQYTGYISMFVYPSFLHSDILGSLPCAALI